MSALIEDRDTRTLIGPMGYTREVAAANKIYSGGLVAQNAEGKAVPASDASGLVVLGVAMKTAGGGEGGVIKTGKFLLENGSSTEALTTADIGKVCYALDDQTVGKVGGTNKVRAGRVLDVIASGVVVHVSPVAADDIAISDVTGLQIALDGKANTTE